MYPIYDTNGNLIGYYDDNMSAYNPDTSPMMGADGLQMQWTGTQFLTTSEVNFAATGTTGAAASSIPTVNSNTPPASGVASSLIKTLTGQTYQYNAQGTNPVLVSSSGFNMSNIMLYGGLGLVAYIALTGGKSKPRRASRRR